MRCLGLRRVGFVLAVMVAWSVSFSGNGYGENDVLRIGTTPNYPPLISKEDDSYAGLEAELVLALGEELGRKIEFVDIAWKDLLPALESKEVDMILGGLSIERTRKERINFTEYFLPIGHAVLVREDDVIKYPSAVSLRTTSGTVGYEFGTTGEALANRIFVQAKTKGFSGAEDSVEALRSGDIDMMIYDIPEVWWLSENEEGVAPVKKQLSYEFLAWGIHKDNKDLLEDVNAVLEQWKMDGTMVEAVQYYLPYLQEFSEEDDVVRNKLSGRRMQYGTKNRPRQGTRGRRSRGSVSFGTRNHATNQRLR